MLSLSDLDKIFWYKTDDVDDQLQLLSLIGSWKQWESSEKLNHYASHAPHIYCLSIWEYTQHYFWSTIEPALYVSVDDLFIESATSKISNDNATLVFLFEENIFRF